MAASRVGDVLAAINTTFTTALGGVPVWDGPWPTLDAPQDLVLVAHDGADEGEGPYVTATRMWESLGNPTASAEDIAVTCAAVAWAGDIDLTTRRARAYELAAACEAAIPPNLGLAWVQRARVTDTQLHQATRSTASQARVVFTVSCTALL